MRKPNVSIVFAVLMSGCAGDNPRSTALDASQDELMKDAPQSADAETKRDQAQDPDVAIPRDTATSDEGLDEPRGDRPSPGDPETADGNGADVPSLGDGSPGDGGPLSTNRKNFGLGGASLCANSGDSSSARISRAERPIPTNGVVARRSTRCTPLAPKPGTSSSGPGRPRFST